MSYCITLRSGTDETITGWYAGGNTRWSADHTRQKRFNDRRHAIAVCHELRDLSPSYAPVINIELAEGEPNPTSCIRPERLRGAERLYEERASHLELTAAKTSPPLAPAAGWTVCLLVSLGLWWGIWLAASSLISAVW
jgi:hypothetical protein